MEIRNAADMNSRADSTGQGFRVTQLHPDGPAGHALMAVDLWEIDPGGSTPLTGHAEEHVLFVIAGTGEVSGSTQGGLTAKVGPNSVVHVGHREVHAIRNTGNETLRLLVSTPLL